MSATYIKVRSAIALNALPALAPYIRVRFLLPGIAVLALVAVVHQVRLAPPPPPRLTVAHAVAKAVQPSAPSVYAQEQTMAPGDLMKRWEPVIAQASRKFHVDAEWIRAVMRAESGGRTMLAENVPMISTAGAVGVMQVMPETYAEMRAQYGLGADPYDPHDNIFAGAAYLNFLHQKYGYPAMFAAYNDGPGNVEDNITEGRPFPKETQGYVGFIARALKDPSVAESLTKVALTQPDGAKVEIDATKVNAVREALPGLYAPGVRAVISMGRLNRGVREDVALATQLLRAHGARL